MALSQTCCDEFTHFKLDPLHVDDINNPDHPSYFFVTPEYALLIIRLFSIDDSLSSHPIS